MLYKYFKNGNIHVKFDSDIDSVEDNYSYADMICIIYNSMLDCVAYDNFDSYFSTIAIINQANGETYDYVIPYDEIDKFFAGKWVVLYGIDKHAYIHIPSFYASGDFTDANGHKFGYYKLCEKPSADFIDEMKLHGCMFHILSPMYAPEQKHFTMFVPYGARIRYE